MKEKKTVFKLFFVWDFEKEERWLNEMAQEGWVLDNTGFSFYTFVRCEPGEYIIRLEMNPSSDYRAFVKELGAEYIGGCVNWVYFRRKAELGSFELLSDIDASEPNQSDAFPDLSGKPDSWHNELSESGSLRLAEPVVRSNALLCTGTYPRHESSAGKGTQFARMICQSLLRHNRREKSGVSLDKKTIANCSPS